MRGILPHSIILPQRKRDRVYDPGTKRWYKDGYAPFQLPEVVESDCLRCGGQGTLSIRKWGATCSLCSVPPQDGLQGA